MRELARVERILSVNPIPGADAIEVAQVLGWNIVVRKGEFLKGDLCVFFEIDSFLSADDVRYASFQDRFTNWGDKRGMRLKTIKLRGQISQGLVLKVSEFAEIKKPVEGMDVTELLKIEKWESLVEQNSNSGGGKNFPSFIQKTDQTRVQSYMSHLPRFVEQDENFELSVKLDGSSMTIFHLNQQSKYFNIALDEQTKKIKGRLNKLVYGIKKLFGMIKRPDDVFGVCSRNLLLDIDSSNHFMTYVKQHSVMQRLWDANKNYALQGELIGPSIQKNYEKVSENMFYVFDVFDIDNQCYLFPVEARAFCELIDVAYVPVLMTNAYIRNTKTDDPMEVITDPIEYVKNILILAEGPGMNPGVKREGIVWKSNKTKNVSFKAISNSYLLAKEKKQK